jgi:hypothetical protein
LTPASLFALPVDGNAGELWRTPANYCHHPAFYDLFGGWPDEPIRERLPIFGRSQNEFRPALWLRKKGATGEPDPGREQDTLLEIALPR